jgi:hypothetical protein
MKTFSKAPESFKSQTSAAPSSTQSPAAHQTNGGTAGPKLPAYVESGDSDFDGPADVVVQRRHPKYASYHQAHLPIVINQFPPSFAPWSPEDQYQMSKWNYYASGVFQVYATPTGTFGWGNGRFDLDGWPDSATLQSVYGQGWDPGTRAITFLNYDGNGWITEADVALNPAYSWTLDDQWVYDGGPAKSFHRSLTHELGHVHGMEHQFNYLSVMNYPQDTFRFFGLPYMDDAEGVRAEYPGNAVAVTDLAVYLYYSSAYQTFADATYPTTVEVGRTLTVNNYTVENVGTTTITTPTLEWYLTAARNYSSAYYYLGSSTYSSLGRFSYFDPGSVSRTFTIPDSVPPGVYYLNAYIRNDGGATESSFPSDNNRAFSRLTVTVTLPTALANATPVSYSDIPKTFSFSTYSYDWCAVGIASTADHDIMAADSPAFSSPYAYSTYGGTVRDFVVLNGHTVGTGTHYAQVYYGSPGTYTIEGEWDIPDLGLGSPYGAFMSGAEVLDAYEIYLPAGQQYQCAVDVSSGGADLGVYVFKPSQTYGSRGTAAWRANNAGPGGNEAVVITTDTTGDYGIVVINENGGSASYSIVVRTPPPPTMTTPVASAGAFHFQITGAPGATYIIQKSLDLVHWVSLSTVTIPASGTLVINDPIVANQPTAFYRAVLR